MDEARGEEATQSGQQQECILSGGVYLRHRLRKASFQKTYLLCFPHTSTLSHLEQVCQYGVLACWRARNDLVCFVYSSILSHQRCPLSTEDVRIIPRKTVAC
jgi:hypothetical protein